MTAMLFGMHATQQNVHSRSDHRLASSSRPVRPGGCCGRVRASYEPDTMRDLPVPASPPSRAPPPPPPPPPPPAPEPWYLNRRVIMTVGLGAVGLVGSKAVISVLRGVGGGREQELKELAYTASQIGLQGFGPPVSAVATPDGKEILGLLARAKDGSAFLVKVDEVDSSRLLLKSERDGSEYALETPFRRLDLRDRRLMESIFRTPDWEKELKRLR